MECDTMQWHNSIELSWSVVAVTPLYSFTAMQQSIDRSGSNWLFAGRCEPLGAVMLVAEQLSNDVAWLGFYLAVSFLYSWVGSVCQHHSNFGSHLVIQFFSILSLPCHLRYNHVNIWKHQSLSINNHLQLNIQLFPIRVTLYPLRGLWLLASSKSTEITWVHTKWKLYYGLH